MPDPMRFLRRFKAQEGVTLIMAIGILGVLSITGATLIYYSSSNARSASSSKANETAYTLAEAGVAQALSVLNNALNPLTGSLLQSTTLELEGGSVTYSGTLNGTTWTITSTGAVTNPTGAAAVKRTLTRNAEVYGLNSGANVAAWNRWYSNQTSCLTVEDVTITMPLATRGGLCMVGNGQVTGSGTTVEVGGNVTMTANNTSGARSPSTAAGWTTSTNVASSNNAYATASIAASGQSANLDSTGFGFTIPTGATITGIQVDIERKASATSSIEDYDVYVLKGGSATGITDHASTTDWTTSDATRSYGNSSDLWGTTWTVTDINASNFGVRLKALNLTTSAKTASVDWVQITVFYTPLPSTTIGTSGTPLASVQVTGTCKYAAQSTHTPCTSADKVWANTIGTAPQNLSMPAVDLAYWYDNAKPGPEEQLHDRQLPGRLRQRHHLQRQPLGSAEVTPTSSSYTCQVKDSLGNLLGEISWDHVTHVLKIKGTIFIDGDFRFDDDGQIVHYQGRGIIYAAGAHRVRRARLRGRFGHELLRDDGHGELGPQPEPDDRARRRHRVDRGRVRPGLDAGPVGPVGAPGPHLREGRVHRPRELPHERPHRLRQPHPPVLPERLADLLRLAAAGIARRGADVLEPLHGRRLRRRPRTPVRLIVPLQAIHACSCPAITLRWSSPSRSPRLPALAARDCDLQLDDRDAEAGQHHLKEH